MTRLTFKDTKVNGLKRELSTGIYYIHLNLIGVGRLRKSTKTKDYNEALELLKKIQQSGHNLFQQTNEKITLYDAIDKFLEWSLNVKKITNKSFKNRKTRMMLIKNYFDNIYLQEFNIEMYEKWLSHRRTNNGIKNQFISDATLNSDISEHKSFFKFCNERPSKINPYIRQNPIEDVALNKIERRSEKAHPETVVLNYLIFVKEHNYRLFEFSFLTYIMGLRRSETLRLKWDDIHISDNMSYAILRNTKGKRERRVPIPESGILLLNKIKKYPKVFIVNKGRLNIERKVDNSENMVFPELLADTVTHQTKKLADKFANIYGANPKNFNLRLHGLRHSFATGLNEDGIPIKKIKDLLGHKRESTTEIYIGLHDSEKNVVVQKFNAVEYKKLVD
jgi:site-specific recombinase XerD